MSEADSCLSRAVSWMLKRGEQAFEENIAEDAEGHPVGTLDATEACEDGQRLVVHVDSRNGNHSATNVEADVRQRILARVHPTLLDVVELGSGNRLPIGI